MSKRSTLFADMLDFLQELQQNNHKPWMDMQRKRYQSIRKAYIRWLEGLDAKLAAADPTYVHTPGKKAINRINTNLLYHPDRPPYKDNFGASLDKGEKRSEFYIHISPSGSFIAGGIYHPPAEQLKSLREAIDYNGERLKELLNAKEFRGRFGSLLSEGDDLKTAPKGYTQDHTHIALLRKKSFAVSQPLSRAQVCSASFEREVMAAYECMLPFRRYLDKALTV